MKSPLLWRVGLDAFLNLPRLLTQWWYVRKLPSSQLQKLMARQEGQEGKEGKEQPMSLLILDVRSREEFSGELGHLEGAVLLPLPELGSRLDELSPYRMQTIVTV